MLRKVVNTLKRMPENVNPTWLRCPESIQIDTTNHCNAACEYCNVKESGSFNIPRGWMDTEMVKYIIRYWGKHPEVKIIAPFMNGEPMLDDRMTMIFDYTQEHAPNAYNVIDTNGIAYKNRELLIHPNLKTVRFSISANNRVTYRKVHGVDKFNDVMQTVSYFLKNKEPTQRAAFHFMVTRNNEHEIEGWIDRFSGHLRKVFPLHRMPGIQQDSETSLGDNQEWIIKDDTLENWAKTRPLYIYRDGSRDRRLIPHYQTCQGMSFAVQWDGLIMHCTDAPPYFNYGYVGQVDMLESWHVRNKARLTNEACIACNSKRPDWAETLKKYFS